jgi:hypothetical protein
MELVKNYCYIAAKISYMPYRFRHRSYGSLDNTQLIILCTVVVIVIILVSFFSRKAVVSRKLKKAPLRRIADFKNGEVAKIVGTVEFVDAPLEAPLSGRKCVWYYIHIEKQTSNGKGGSWNSIIKENQRACFVLREGNTVAFIDTDNIKSYIVEDDKYKSGTFNDATQALENYLNRHGHKSENWLGLNKNLRYSEGVLEENEQVAVLGEGHWRKAETVGLPRHYGQVLVITAPLDSSVYLSDDFHTVTMHGA